MVYEKTTETRQAIIDACLRMNAEGINQGTSGNISVRVGEEMLITPSGIPYDQLTPKDIIRVRLESGQVRGLHKPSSEWRFHCDLLQARPDMQAVVHAHPVHCTALSMLRQPLPACHYMIGLFGGSDVPVAGYARYGSAALSEAVVAVMEDRHGCLMANHGATVLGEDLGKALWRLGELEILAQSYLAARAVGEVVLLSDQEMAEAIEAFKDYGPK
ncbi:L-fuculose-phosphate aldolase [Cognatiyoonia sediminum]|uniref:L-fuculose-phosphate aldolase n=1 Tax=Cognatiyoonia sediminum TaxID=1508389 RepID=A0A1M5QVZ2_9RHOB|nr:class II aldolase/adducin family protein [Cognatiyoonia sediminum]SHH18081.1 L-fuculose-phosphate aldolase [Cognatiyoonia sediminum]